MRARALVDLSAIRKNLSLFRARVEARSPGTGILAVVKADAYGHGACAVARAVEDGVSGFAVATAEEALALRKVTPRPVLVLGAILPEMLSELYKASVAVSLFSADCAALYADGRRALVRRGAIAPGARLRVHIALDTGMRRLGFAAEAPEIAVRAARALLTSPDFCVAGIYSHLHSPESETETELQRAKMAAVLSRLPPSPPLLSHLAAGEGALRFGSLGFRAVRPGLLLYGIGDPAFIPALRIEATAVQIHRLHAGDGVGYGLAFRAGAPGDVGIFPFGYADGLPRAASGCPVRLLRPDGTETAGTVCGRVSMDSCAVFAPAIPPGTTAVFSPEEIARASGTIPYEILCGIGTRVPRVYTDHPYGGQETKNKTENL